MPSSNFGDTRGRRAANQELKTGNFWVADVRWWPQLQQAMQTLSTRALAKPAGLDPDGKFWLRPDLLADTMLVRYVLWYREMPRGPGSGGVRSVGSSETTSPTASAITRSPCGRMGG